MKATLILDNLNLSSKLKVFNLSILKIKVWIVLIRERRLRWWQCKNTKSMTQPFRHHCNSKLANVVAPLEIGTSMMEQARCQ
jgi:hypothetical protein